MGSVGAGEELAVCIRWSEKTSMITWHLGRGLKKVRCEPCGHLGKERARRRKQERRRPVICWGV